MSTVPSPGSTRLQHLQILRAIAASLVVITHSFSSLRPHGLDDPRFHVAADTLGGLGVGVFFVLSGLIMVRHSADRFGTRTYPLLFAGRRLLRIVPIYWIATMLWYWSLSHSGPPIPSSRRQLVLSLCFVPDFHAGQYRLNPILGQGWTLNYEMAFYVLFALALLLPRRIGITALVAVISAAGYWGLHHFPPPAPAPIDLIRFYTDRVILFFAAGVLLGALDIALKRRAPVRIPVSPALLLLLPAAILLVRPDLAPEAGAYSWPGLVFATALVALCSLTANVPSGRLTPALVLLGDASYSTYLFHLWVFGWTNPRVLRLYAHLHSVPASPFAFIAAAIVAANLLGLVIYLAVERPITQLLRYAAAAAKQVRRNSLSG